MPVAKVLRFYEEVRIRRGPPFSIRLNYQWSLRNCPHWSTKTFYIARRPFRPHWCRSHKKARAHLMTNCLAITNLLYHFCLIRGKSAEKGPSFYFLVSTRFIYLVEKVGYKYHAELSLFSLTSTVVPWGAWAKYCRKPKTRTGKAKAKV